MIRRADTMGVFQIESRAQMAMLPRLRPNKFYDLVIEVAIVRPGPIQGDMVHPYLRRRAESGRAGHVSQRRSRAGPERTLGVPIFQEQVMQLAIVAAGFTAGEADQPTPAPWLHGGAIGDLERFEQSSSTAWSSADYPEEFAQRLFRQIKGFGEYGFPRVARRELRALGVRLGLAQVSSARGILLRVAEQPADGLLCAATARSFRRAIMASRCAPSTSTKAIGIARSSAARTVARPFASACGS